MFFNCNTKLYILIIGAAELALALFILICMHENPAVHPRISKDERDFILNNQENYLIPKVHVSLLKYVFKIIILIDCELYHSFNAIMSSILRCNLLSFNIVSIFFSYREDHF